MTKIATLLNESKPSISFEVFPPKTETGLDSVMGAALSIARLNPIFMSVTYGAAGGTRKYTADIAETIQTAAPNVAALAHLTCVSLADEDQLHRQLDDLKARGIENILALRGDLPADMAGLSKDYPYQHANELTAAIKAYGDFCIGGACYPERHPESATKAEDIDNIKKKVEAGCDFLTTQMFFDNSIMYNYMYKLRDAGIRIPICAGIMPITNKSQIEKSIRLSGAVLPAKFLALVDRFGDDPKAMTQAGIAYATDQIIDLIANGVDHIHVYSMNKPAVAEGIARNLSDIIPGLTVE